MNMVLGDALSLLLFRLHSGRLLGINLLKVNEIIPCPTLTKMPSRHPHVRGVATLRGSALTVIDLARAIGERGGSDDGEGCLIVTELSRSRQGLHVHSVERIVQCSTRDVRPPPSGAGTRAFITGGPLAGLVAICAGSDLMHPVGALVTGAIAGALFVWAFTATQVKWKIDDVLGVWPLHGLCGVWGGIACGIFGQPLWGGLGGVSLASQLLGSLAGVAVALLGGFAVYGMLKALVGIRLSQEQEYYGADLSIHRIGSISQD